MTPSERTPTRLLLVVSGGIAAYKSCEVVRRLRDQGFAVRVAMTRSAQQFVTPTTFGALSAQPVGTSLFEAARAHEIDHVRWAEWADIVLVAPATANFLARLAHGIGDDFASTVLLASPAPLIVAPAMEDDMYRQASVQRNLATLRGRSAMIVGPATGALASGRQGPGRMLEPEGIVAACSRVRDGGSPRPDLEGTRVLLTVGPTAESLDPIRFLTNRSSGRMGFAMAQEAAWRGAGVTVVHGPCAVPTLDGVETVAVESAAQMYDATMERVGAADIAVFSAAVADFTLARPSPSKLKKLAGVGLTLDLIRTRDILADAGKLADRPFLVGFAAETEDLQDRAFAKLESKGCDVIVANQVGREDVGMGADDNEVLVLSARGCTEIARAAKQSVARQIWSTVIEHRGGRP